jgi:branched chain amino acid efflux pump
MTTLVLVVSLTIGTIAFKIAGPVLAGGRTPPPWASRVIALLTPALISALVLVGTFSINQSVVLDARAVGLLAGLIALLARAPLTLALVAAAAATALCRLVG